jgi:hypothetical protein
MNFYIKENSTLPVLTMELIQNGISSNKTMNERLQNANITFFMEEVGSCIPVIQCAPCCILVEQECSDCHEKVYIQYKWTLEDTARKGKYKGWFEITFNDDQSVLIAPIRQTLDITIL